MPEEAAFLSLRFSFTNLTNFPWFFLTHRGWLIILFFLMANYLRFLVWASGRTSLLQADWSADKALFGIRISIQTQYSFALEWNKANPPLSIHIYFCLCLSKAIFFILPTSKVIAYAVPSMCLLGLQTSPPRWIPSLPTVTWIFTAHQGILIPCPCSIMQPIHAPTVTHQWRQWWFICGCQASLVSLRDSWRCSPVLGNTLKSKSCPAHLSKDMKTVYPFSRTPASEAGSRPCFQI